MDKLEYIPGDLVMVDNDIVKVMARSVNYFLKIINNYDVMFHSGNVYKYSPNKLKPIPITPEILEKNGWDFIGYKMDFSGSMFNIYGKHDILPDLYYYYATKDFSVSFRGKVVLPNMKYIHELQHLLFGLGLNSEMEV